MICQTELYPPIIHVSNHMQHHSVFIPTTLIAKINCRIAWSIWHRLAAMYIQLGWAPTGPGERVFHAMNDSRAARYRQLPDSL